MLQRMADRDRELQRRIEALRLLRGITYTEAHIYASCEMEFEERDAIQQAKLADIRENGT